MDVINKYTGEFIPIIDGKSRITEEIRSKYLFDNNTFINVAKNNSKDFLEVEVGDSKQPDFYPQVKLKRWDNEVNFSARLVDDEEETPVISTMESKIIWDKTKRSINFYDLPISEEHPEGGYEFEITLKEKPSTNRVSFTLQTKGLDFFYQPELSDDEVREMAERENITIIEAKRQCRPENVVGSYAVYYKNCPPNYKGGKEYRSGKAFHIYRPRVNDAKGNWVYGDLAIDEQNNMLYVDIPQEFLDTAIYPVTHAAGLTFGYTAMGASVWATGYEGSLFTGQVGTLDKITISTQRNASWGYWCYVCGALYKHSDLSLVAQTETRTEFTAAATFEWHDFIANNQTTEAIDYIVARASSSYNGYILNMAYDTGVANQGHYSYTTPSHATPLTLLTTFPAVTHSTNKFSIYATYTAAPSTIDVSISAEVATSTVNIINPTVAITIPVPTFTLTRVGNSVRLTFQGVTP